MPFSGSSSSLQLYGERHWPELSLVGTSEPWLNAEVRHLCVLGTTSHQHFRGEAVRNGSKGSFLKQTAISFSSCSKIPGGGCETCAVAQGTLYIARAVERTWVLGEKLLGRCCHWECPEPTTPLAAQRVLVRARYDLGLLSSNFLMMRRFLCYLLLLE